ncbi:hypothetical protein GCM10029992_51510 [Glycomyces albus]
MNPISKRRGSAALAALASAVLLLGACSGNGGENSNALQILVLKHPLTGSMADMGWVDEIEEAAGIEVEWEEVSADWDQKSLRCSPPATSRTS